MATGQRIAVAALAGMLLLTSAAAASSRRDAATQVSNNVDRLLRPIRREIERLGRWTRVEYRVADHGRAFRRDHRWEDRLRDDAGGSGASGSVAKRRSGEAFEWSRAIAAGKSIEIKGVNGAIAASRATGGEVEVRAVKRARRSDPDEVTIEVIEHEGGVTICAKYPSPRGTENECGPGPKGHMNTHNNDVEVEFEVRVPRGVELIARTVNGDISARDLESPVEAATVNGEVRVSTSGYASAETVNGSILASIGSGGWPEPIAFTTVNGRIDLTLPPRLDADVRAETMNGRIDTDFPVTVKRRFSRRRLQGTIGQGGPQLDLETVNGSIKLRSAS